jgi:FKBP-type peptidyl-prolyl cis-trans isomerase FklB
MPMGSKWQLFIPPQLAFGEQGAGRARQGPKIGPNATVIYELELLAIK